MKKLIDKSITPDVLILAEGTYPYIRGGVSTWIHDLMTGLDDFTFGVVFLGGRRKDYGEIMYELPDNLVYLAEAYLFEDTERPKPKDISGPKEELEYIRELHEIYRKGGNLSIDKAPDVNFFLKRFKETDFLYSKIAWNHIVEMYSMHAPDEPFVDYFWHVRNMHTPLWIVAKIAERVKNFRLIHSPSTGYAGFLGSLLKRTENKPFILTEHGIYTREREIDLLSAPFLMDKRPFINKALGELSPIRKMWTNFYINIGKISYTVADVIISLFEGARRIQIQYGAEPSKCTIIPNGVDTRAYGELLKKREAKIPHVVALIGRVVEIKDVKTFIKAIRLASEELPDIQGWVVGPTDEDPSYYEECIELVNSLELGKNVRFLGFQNVKDILPRVGLVTLTSISEGMPFVVLESFAAGVPCVATDVGSCRQLIYGGLNEEDIEIGKAGEVVGIADTSALAKSYVKLLTDEYLWKSCQKAALERVNKFYSREAFLNNYRNLYERCMTWQV